MNDSKIKIEVLTKEKFAQNPEFYQKSFDSINQSQNFEIIRDYQYLFNTTLLMFIVYIAIDGEIISYGCAYSELYASEWELDSISTRKGFEEKGYASQILSVCLEELAKKGCRKLVTYPNEHSHAIFEKAAGESPFVTFLEYNNKRFHLEMQELIEEEQMQR